MAHVLRIAAVVGTWYPPAVLALLYGHWGIAYCELGRAPVALQDDPKYIGVVTPVVHWVAVLVLGFGYIPFLASASILLVSSLVPKLPNRADVLRRLGMASGGGVLVYTLSRLDPWRVFEWFAD